MRVHTSNIRVTQNHHQYLQIIKNYPILLDPFEKIKILLSLDTYQQLDLPAAVGL